MEDRASIVTGFALFPFLLGGSQVGARDGDGEVSTHLAKEIEEALDPSALCRTWRTRQSEHLRKFLGARQQTSLRPPQIDCSVDVSVYHNHVFNYVWSTA